MLDSVGRCVSGRVSVGGRVEEPPNVMAQPREENMDRWQVMDGRALPARYYTHRSPLYRLMREIVKNRKAVKRSDAT